jgi:hypothetical protein
MKPTYCVGKHARQLVDCKIKQTRVIVAPSDLLGTAFDVYIGIDCTQSLPACVYNVIRHVNRIFT